MGGDPHQVIAIHAIAIPRVWTLPAVAAGKLSMPHAELVCARHAAANGGLTTEIEGRTH